MRSQAVTVGATGLAPTIGDGLVVPLVGGGSARYVNLDYAASSPALTAVAEHLDEVLPFYASVHRGAGYASRVSTAAYERSRSVVGRHVGARETDHVIFTRNTTDALNLLASVVPGETVVLDIEHHANLLPWEPRRVLRAGPDLETTLLLVEEELTRRRAALLTITGASNVTGEVLPLRAFADVAHRRGARLAVDAAQLVPHRRVDMQAQGVDYLAFSGHKAYAPWGAGALIGRRDWLDDGDPYLRGGGAVSSVELDHVAWRTGSPRHEAGTPNVLGVLALSRALTELEHIGEEARTSHEAALRRRLLAGLESIPGATVLRIFPELDDVVGVVSFAVDPLPAGLVAAALSAEHGIGVRHGKLCAHPLLRRLGRTDAVLRASFGLGSTADDVDALLVALSELTRQGPRNSYLLSGENWEPEHDDRGRPDWASSADITLGAYGCGT